MACARHRASRELRTRSHDALVGRTTSTTQTLSYPISMSSAYQIPRHQTGDDFVLPATIDQTLSQATTTRVNGATTWSSSLSDAIHGQALLMRNQNTGQNVAANGTTSEQYVYSDSSGACFNHTLAATYTHRSEEAPDWGSLLVSCLR